MLSRIFWVGIAGVALLTGMFLQDGDEMFGWGQEAAIAMEAERALDAEIEQAVDASVDRAIDGGVDRMQVIGADGNEIDVPAQTKRAMAEAVGRLVKAQADLAILKVGDAGEGEIRAATALRDQARADVDRVKAQIEDLEQAATTEQEAVREQVQQEIRDEIRTEIREAVRG